MSTDKITVTKSILVGQYVSGTLHILYEAWPPKTVKKKFTEGTMFRVSVEEHKPFIIINKNAKSENENCANENCDVSWARWEQLLLFWL